MAGIGWGNRLLEARMDEMKEIIEGLREAMRAERTGAEFYRMAAQTTKDPVGRRTFEMLAKEEEEHFEYLRRQYKSLAQTGKVDELAKLGTAASMAHDSPIFSPELRGRIKGAHFEMSALAIAVQLELKRHPAVPGAGRQSHAAGGAQVLHGVGGLGERSLRRLPAPAADAPGGVLERGRV